MSGIVELHSVVQDDPLEKTVVHAVRGVDLVIEKGEFAAIAGPSGSGKTTILNKIGRVDVPTSGTVVVDGQSTGSLTDRQLTRLRAASHRVHFSGIQPD